MAARVRSSLWKQLGEGGLGAVLWGPGGLPATPEPAFLSSLTSRLGFRALCRLGNEFLHFPLLPKACGTQRKWQLLARWPHPDATAPIPSLSI